MKIIMNFSGILLLLFLLCFVQILVFLARNLINYFEIIKFKLQTIEIDLLSFERLSNSDPEFCDFGTLRLKKKGRNQFVVSGEFKYLKTFGDEIDVSIN
jgi:hypothetical protein